MVRLLLVAMIAASLLPVSGLGRDLAQGLANAAVFVLFLLYGIKLSRAEVLAGVTNVRLLGPLLLWVFGVMALAGWLLWQGTAGLLPPLLALGFLYLGVLPSTVQSATLYSSLAGGNVAASVVAAALLNIAGVFISAPLFSAIAGGAAGGLQADTLVKVMTMMLLPFAIGQVVQGWLADRVKAHKPVVTFLERGTIGLAVYVSFSGAVTEGIWRRVGATEWGVILFLINSLTTPTEGAIPIRS